MSTFGIFYRVTVMFQLLAIILIMLWCRHSMKDNSKAITPAQKCEVEYIYDEKVKDFIAVPDKDCGVPYKEYKRQRDLEKESNSDPVHVSSPKTLSLIGFSVLAFIGYKVLK